MAGFDTSVSIGLSLSGPAVDVVIEDDEAEELVAIWSLLALFTKAVEIIILYQNCKSKIYFTSLFSQFFLLNCVLVSCLIELFRKPMGS